MALVKQISLELLRGRAVWSSQEKDAVIRPIYSGGTVDFVITEAVTSLGPRESLLSTHL